MAGTRSSTRQALKGNSKPVPAEHSKPASGGAGTKRKASGSAGAKAKKGKKGDEAEQTTIEESLGIDKNDKDEDVKMKDQEVKEQETSGKTDEKTNGNGANEEHQKQEMADAKEEADVKEAIARSQKDEQPDSEKKEQVGTEAGEERPQENKPNGFDKLLDQESKDKEAEDKKVTQEGTGSKVSAAESAVETSERREEATPSSILEKGIIYFFFRGRVGVTEPTNVADIARSYMILRPLPQGAKLGDGPIGDDKTNRMLALPKKVLPQSPKDRFMVFVEKANVSMDEIKDTLSSSDYQTKTAGARHTPAATPIGEGVYAITQTGRETHLAYILTIPAELEAVQKGVGLRKRGSYFTSAKNPQSTSPANASLPQGPEYPQEIIDEFHGRGWMPLQPKLLNYKNTQFLIIGHGDGAFEKAAKPQDGEHEEPKTDTPLEQIEKLEHEDELRVQHLEGDHSIFTDLGLSFKEYPKVQTTW